MATQRLNQIVAIEKGVKTRAQKELTDAHQDLQKNALLSGISRTYKPLDDAGERFPAESTRVQKRADEVIKHVREILVDLFDVTAQRDTTNCVAKADVVVDGKTLAKDVPATYLLWLEKQLVDLKTFVEKLPTLDPSEEWAANDAQACYATPPTQTHKTKKIPRNHVKAEATEKHPAQVEVFMEDVVVGYWTTVKFSGALPARQVNEMLERVEKLQRAVKFAREEANTHEALPVRFGDALLGYLFDKK